MSKESKNPKTQKAAILILAAVMTVSIAALVLTGLYYSSTLSFPAGELSGGNTAQQKKKTGIRPYQNASEIAVYDETGRAFPLSALGGKPAALVFWASWCPKCVTELDLIDHLSEIAGQEGANLTLINKTDGERETVESARDFLAENGIKTAALYDNGLVAYETLGLSRVPTCVTIDAEGRVTGYAEGAGLTENVLRSMLKEAGIGKASALYRIIQERLLGEDGGIRTNYQDGDSSAVPAGGDVLSESQGFMMLAAVAEDDRALFDRLWSWVKLNTAGGGLSAWVTTRDGPSPVNAAIDDLRIYLALCRAEERWGGYASDCAALAHGLYQYNTVDGKLADFYDFSLGLSARRLTLCYADFEGMTRLARVDSRWQTISNNSLALVKAGRISRDFPLYHSYYNYDDNSYHSDTLNISEALVTLLHLSRAGELPAEALGWLRERMAEGVLYAGYKTDGSPALEGRFESSAVYALCALVALSEKDMELAGQAISHLEKLRIRDASSELDGIFGNGDGSGIYSFDQLAALLAYQEMEKAVR